MSEEKLMILNMLKEGKITEEDALKLLEAIGESKPGASAEEKLNDMEENVINRIAGSLDKFIKKTTDAIQNIDFEDWNLGSGSKYKSKTEASVSLDTTEVTDLVLNILNKDGKVQVYTWDNSFIDCKGKIYYDEKMINVDHEFFSMTRDNNTVEIKPNPHTGGSQPFELNLQIALPKRRYGAVKIHTTNGNIEINMVEANYVELTTTNGKLIANSVIADETKLDSTNARIEVLDNEGKKLSASSTNGRIVFNGLYVEEAYANTTNGSIAVTDVSNLLKRLETNTTNGSIRISIANFVRAVKAEFNKLNKYTTKVNLSGRFSSIVRGNTEVIAYTDGYTDEDTDALHIMGSTVNGSINIE